VELDANNTGDLSGVDCGHTVGGIGGPGGAGAGSIKGPVTWSYSSGGDGLNLGWTDPHGQYYAVTITDGSTWDIPRTPGHYSFRPTNGVQIQITVAP
jgi:hypothetical protein